MIYRLRKCCSLTMSVFSWASINHPDRLTHPLVRKNGQLVQTSWDEAMSLVVEKAQDIRRRMTGHAIAFYTSGQLFLEEYYALAVIGKAGLNTLNMHVSSSRKTFF